MQYKPKNYIFRVGNGDNFENQKNLVLELKMSDKGKSAKNEMQPAIQKNAVLTADREVVLAAVTQNRFIFQWIPEELQKDLEIRTATGL